MAGFSDYTENKVLDLLRGVAFTPPSGLYVALYSAAPSDAGGGTEVTTTIRTAGRPAATFGAAAAGAISNTALVDFGASAGAATVTHFALFDAASAGNMLAWAPVTVSLAITAGIVVSFPVAALNLTLD
jgi:hypothetical protein